MKFQSIQCNIISKTEYDYLGHLKNLVHVKLLKRKKTITDIKFLDENDVKDDPLVWNCINVNKFSKFVLKQYYKIPK